MLILHIFANGDLGLKFKKFNTGVSQIPGKCGKEGVGESPGRWHSRTPVDLGVILKFNRFKIRMFRPRSLQHGTGKVFELPNDCAKIWASVNKGRYFASLLHKDEEGNGPIMTTDSPRERLTGPFSPKGKQNIVVTLRRAPLVQCPCGIRGQPLQINPI